MQWTATLKDNRMFGSDEDPNRKALLQSSKDRVLSTLLFGKFAIDFETGMVFINGVRMDVGYTNLPIHYRIIYVITRCVDLGTNFKQIGKIQLVMTKIGWQITHEGRNIKRVLWLRPDGSFSLEDHRK